MSKKKRVLVGVASVLGLLVLVVVGGGALLPVDHVAARSIAVKAAPEAVYGIVADVAGQAGWWPDVKKVEKLADRDGHPCWRQTTGFGDVTFAEVESDRPRKFVTRIADDDLPFGGTWTYELAPAAGGTRLTITERGSVKSPVFRFLSKFVFGHTATMDSFLRALGKKLGEDVTLEPGS